MKTVELNLPQNSYQIHLGKGLLSQVPSFLLNLGFKHRVVVITNPAIFELYGRSLETRLIEQGFTTSCIKIPEGEENKSLSRAGEIYSQLGDLKAERNTPILALGGGVIGDLAGFVAATYMRGVPLIQAPTSLLAQVDSSIGGKTAVNHEKLKNNVGLFYQPRLVVSDVGTLKTLPEKEMENGLAEVIKYGIIGDAEMFEIIQKNIAKLKNADADLIEDIIFRCARKKAHLVEQDERDRGIRNVLNFGHTTAHGLETASNFKLAHGRAVAIGIIVAALLSVRLGYLPRSEYERIKSVIEAAGLPSDCQGFSVAEILLAMQHDKKRTEGKLRFILAKSIGYAFISDEVTEDQVMAVLKEING